MYTNGEQDANSREVKKIGYQIKTGDNQNVNVIDAAVLNHTYLFRGRINSTMNTKLSTQKVGWTYLSVSEMKEFIGPSLQLAVPRGMLVVEPTWKRKQVNMSSTVPSMLNI